MAKQIYRIEWSSGHLIDYRPTMEKALELARSIDPMGSTVKIKLVNKEEENGRD